MGRQEQELEVKFHISNLAHLEARLIGEGAALVQERVHEVNLRFDNEEQSLGRTGQVLRLRQDSQARLTYKGSGVTQDGVQARREIEFSVSDFPAARLMLEALGYQVVMLYEKWRTAYDLGGTTVTLDEMPYGSFAEIEGPDPQVIQSTAVRLGLIWELRLLLSYTAIFDQLKTAQGLNFQDLSFTNFTQIEPNLGLIGILPADRV